jgi:hypothetical protein
VSRSAALVPAFCFVALAPPLRAHEVRPAYLELRQIGPETYDALWKVPARGEMRLGLSIRLPESCVDASPRTVRQGQGAFVERWTASCPGGLAGATISVDGLSATFTDALARIEHQDGAVQTARLTPAAPAFVVEAAPSALGVAGAYLALGVEHILLGADHLLFVLALLLVTGGTWRLVQTVTAFTVAHSITLGLATLGFVRLAPAPVEAVIALSIVFVAAEIVHARQGRDGITARSPWIVAFVFGLLHGLGFAGALREIGLPAQHIPLALLFFNMGVEAGQLLFLGVVLVLAAGARRVRVQAPAWSQLVPAYAIGSMAMFWVIQRIGAFR